MLQDTRAQVAAFKSHLVSVLQVFGALTSCSLHVSDHFYGTGESLLFRFTPKFQAFNWTGDNLYFIKGNNESLAIGAGEYVYTFSFPQKIFFLFSISFVKKINVVIFYFSLAESLDFGWTVICTKAGRSRAARTATSRWRRARTLSSRRWSAGRSYRTRPHIPSPPLLRPRRSPI